MAEAAQPKLAQALQDGVAVGRSHLNDHAELFIEECAQGGVVAPRTHLAGPIFGVTNVCSAVAQAVAWRHQHIDIEAHAAAPGKRHFADRGPQAAIAAVVVGQEQAVLSQVVDGFHQGDQFRGAMQVRHAIALRAACLPQNLGEHRARHALPPLPEVDQDQDARNLVQLRRQGAAHVVQAGKCRNHEAHRRRDLFVNLTVTPTRAHREAVFAHRHADAKRWTEV